jgi:hypothetical protein
VSASEEIRSAPGASQDSQTQAHFLQESGSRKFDFGITLFDMSNKQIVKDLLQRIPEGASLHEIAREIEFIAAVRQGLAELDLGEQIPIEEVERELPSWIIK